MTRKTQFTAKDIIMAAIELVRENSLSGLTAAFLAEKLGCSTMPIYYHFKNMQEIEDEVVKFAWRSVMDYQSESYTSDVWVDQAIGWVLFSRDEDNLFECLTDNSNKELRIEMQIVHWQFLADMLQDYDRFQDMDELLRERVRHAHAMLTHGVATSPPSAMNKIILEKDGILFGYMTAASQALMKGYKQIPPPADADVEYVKARLEELKGRAY